MIPYTVYRTSRGVYWVGQSRHREVDHGRRQGILRRGDTALDPALSRAIRLGKARDRDLRRPLGPDDPQPGPEPPGRGLGPLRPAGRASHARPPGAIARARPRALPRDQV